MTNEEFVAKLEQVYDGKNLDFSEVRFKTLKDNVTVICPVHSRFEVRADILLSGRGCKECAKEERRRRKERDFISKAKMVHNGKYDYSLVVFERMDKEACIICPIHGQFWQKPQEHLRGHGCQECAGNKKKTRETFIRDARKKHGDKYDYSLVDFVDMDTPVQIICRKHGPFWQIPKYHLSGRGCRLCAGESRSTKQLKSTERFIADAKRVHPDGEYDYSLVEYRGAHEYVWIICLKKDQNGKIHGPFRITPTNFLSGNGCWRCVGNKKKSTMQFVKEAEETHGKGKYDYSLSDYDGAHSKVAIICHEKDENGVEHGVFLQSPYNHVRKKCGCPKCRRSHMEETVALALDRLGIRYEQWKQFPWLGKQELDFYLMDCNIAIECQGGQHYFPVEHFGGEEKFKKQQERDERKKALCEDNGINIFYIRYDENTEEVLNNILTDVGIVNTR